MGVASSALLDRVIVFQRRRESPPVITAGRVIGVETDEAGVLTVRVRAAAEDETYELALTDESVIHRVEASGNKREDGVLANYIVVE